MPSESSSPSSVFMHLFMGTEWSSCSNTQMSLPPSVHPDTTWMFNVPSMAVHTELPQAANLLSSPASAPGPSDHEIGNLLGYNTGAQLPVDWFNQATLSHATGSNSATPASSVVRLHRHFRLPGTEDENLDQLLETTEDSEQGRKTFRCIWPGCTVIPFTGKSQAYTHVRKHLGVKKLYGCAACNALFATRGAATRHVESQQTSFECCICHKSIKRKDYWRKHQRMCASKAGQQ